MHKIKLQILVMLHFGNLANFNRRKFLDRHKRYKYRITHILAELRQQNKSIEDNKQKYISFE